MKYDTVKLHNLNFEQVYYLPGAPKILIIPQKWAREIEEDEVGREGIYLKAMGKYSVLVWNTEKPQITILHALGCDIPETSTNQGQEGLTKFFTMVAEFFKE